MKTSVIISLAIVGLMCLVSDCDALKCYSCQYREDDDGKEISGGSTTACGDDTFDASKLNSQDCGSGNYMCVRVYSSKVKDGTTSISIVRGCAKTCINFNSGGDGYDDGKEISGTTSQGCCDSNECNGASTVGYLGLNLVVTFLVAIYLKV